MARHQQRPEKRLMVCPRCKSGDCTRCVDVTRSKFTSEKICQCERTRHVELVTAQSEE